VHLFDSICCLQFLESGNPNCISCRSQDEWSTLAVKCVEQFSRSSDLLNVIPSCSSSRLSGVDKMHTFQRLVDCCSQLASSHGPLWPECYSALLVELYRLLVTEDKEKLLYAMQLSIILLARNTSSNLRCLLLFMRCAASSTQVSLSTKACIKTVFNCIDIKCFFIPWFYVVLYDAF